MSVEVHLRTGAERAIVPSRSHPGDAPPTDRDVRRVSHGGAADGVCPECGADLVVRAGIRRIDGGDRGPMVADAVCADCNEHIGALVEWYHGIFGRIEDRAVTAGRPRVY